MRCRTGQRLNTIGQIDPPFTCPAAVDKYIEWGFVDFIGFCQATRCFVKFGKIVDFKLITCLLIVGPPKKRVMDNCYKTSSGILERRREE